MSKESTDPSPENNPMTHAAYRKYKMDKFVRSEIESLSMNTNNTNSAPAFGARYAKSPAPPTDRSQSGNKSGDQGNQRASSSGRVSRSTSNSNDGKRNKRGLTPTPVRGIEDEYRDLSLVEEMAALARDQKKKQKELEQKEKVLTEMEKAGGLPQSLINDMKFDMELLRADLEHMKAQNLELNNKLEKQGNTVAANMIGGKLAGAAATWYTDPLVLGIILAVGNVILGVLMALLLPTRFFATDQWQRVAKPTILGTTLAGAGIGGLGMVFYPKHTAAALGIFDLIYLVVLIFTSGFAYEFDVALSGVLPGNGAKNDHADQLLSFQKVTSLQDYITIIEGKAAELFKHDSKFILATMCAAISSNVDGWVHERCTEYTTPDFVKSALQSSWTNKVGFKLFSLVRKAEVNKVVHSIQGAHRGLGTGFFITDLHICDKIKYTTPLFVDTSDIGKVARLLWLLRYMHSVYGEGNGQVNNKWIPSPGDPADIAASLLRCFDRRYSSDNAIDVLYGRLPSDISHTSHVLNIVNYMTTFDTSELSDSDQKKKYTGLLTDAF